MLYGFDGKQPSIEINTYVSETAILVGDVRIGSYCYIGHGAVLRGDYGTIEIGDETTIEEGVIVHAPPGEYCSIRNRVVIGHGAIVHARIIGEKAGVGMGAILSVRSEIGEESVIAEGAIVKQGQHIEPRIMAAGNPARKIRDISSNDREFWAYSRRLYVDLAKKYLAIGMLKVEISSPEKDLAVNDIRGGHTAQVPKDVWTAWDSRKGPVVFTTVDANGLPNAIYASCVSRFDDHTVVIADNYFEKTKSNILDGSKGSILFITGDDKSFQLKGTIEYHTEGKLFDDMKKWNPTKHPGHAAAALKVEEVYAGSRKLM